MYCTGIKNHLFLHDEMEIQLVEIPATTRKIELSVFETKFGIARLIKNCHIFSIANDTMKFHCPFYSVAGMSFNKFFLPRYKNHESCMMSFLCLIASAAISVDLLPIPLHGPLP